MMEAAGGERKSLALDIAFHGAVAEGSRNTILTQFLHNIRTKLEEYIVKSLHVPHSADQAIPDAIRSRDVLRARMGMRFHLLVFDQACSIICRIGGAESRALFASPTSRRNASPLPGPSGVPRPSVEDHTRECPVECASLP
jgi:hypothetical protein